jgi:hypothetical protein
MRSRIDYSFRLHADDVSVRFPHMRMPTFPAALCLAGVAACGSAAEPQVCTDAAVIATLPDPIGEASGVAASRTHDGILWVHNDSEGSPQLYAIDTAGRLIAEIAVPAGGRQSDWEDIALGPCPAGQCLYIGDIGDNFHDRDDRAILRITEPDPRATAADHVERFPIAYPGGPRDAEALFVMPDSSVYVLSKGRDGPITLFRYPPPLRAGVRVTLEQVQQLSPGLVQLPDLVTGADAAADGSIVAVRSYAALRFFRFVADTLVEAAPHAVDLAPLGEPQGEGVALAAAGVVYLVSEHGPERLPPPLSRLRCPVR